MAAGATDSRWKQLEWHCGVVQTKRCVIAGFDNSSASRTALAYASGWAHRNHAGLIVVYVESLEAPRSLEAVLAVTAALPTPSCVPLDLSAFVAEVVAGTQTPWAYLNADGDIARQLEAVADAFQADAIIVGRSRRGRHRLRGSVCRRLVATSRRIVVVVP